MNMTTDQEMTYHSFCGRSRLEPICLVAWGVYQPMPGPRARVRTNGPIGCWLATVFRRRCCVATDSVAVPLADGGAVAVAEHRVALYKDKRIVCMSFALFASLFVSHHKVDHILIIGCCCC